MGYPMAGHLVVAGHDVTVWNRTFEKTKNWVAQYDGKGVANLQEATASAEFVILCVGKDDDVKAVVEPALEIMLPGSIIIDHTTASRECALYCYKLAKEKGVGFIDAPISGGEVGAQKGQLTIMCGGDQPAYDRAFPIMQAYAKAVRLMGDAGAGQLTKMVNQICIAGLLQGLSEGLHFAQKAGLDIAEVVEAIGKGAAQSWQMDNRALTMANSEFDFGFAVDWMRKDLGIALEAAQKVGANLTVTQLVDDYYAEIQSMGGGRWDTSSLIKRLL